MGIPEIVTWYQKKIGTYDKQQWEKTIEQRILYGLTHIQKKSTKLKTELIDLDLVQGSSFTKTKPKHGFVTVARLATLRFLFLPLYSKWWVQQTSAKVFAILLILYILQLVNIAVYSYNSSRLPDDSTENVPCTEIIVPIIMMWVLSLIHLQIVSTNSGPICPQNRTKKRTHFRRRRCNLRVRNLISNKTTEVKDESTSYSKSESNRSRSRLFDTNFTKKSVIFETVNLEQNSLPVDVARNDNLRVEKRPRKVSDGQHLDDDGFESLNGNGSSPSGDETTIPKDSSPFDAKDDDRSYNTSPDIDKDSDSDVKIEKNFADAEIQFRKSASNLHSRCNEWVQGVIYGKKQGNASGLSRRLSAPDLRFSAGELDSETDTDTHVTIKNAAQSLLTRRNSQVINNKPATIESTCDSEEEGECETISSPETTGSGCRIYADVTTSATDWIGVTTNSEDCSYSSDFDQSDEEYETNHDHVVWDTNFAPAAILNPSTAASDRVSCAIWERHEVKKAELSVLDISSAIIARVEEMPESMDYFYAGIFMATVLATLPALYRLGNSAIESPSVNEVQFSMVELSGLLLEKMSGSIVTIMEAAFGATWWERTVMIIAAVQRWVLASIFFFLLTVAERTFKQRFLYAKLFSHLTSSRRARKSELPHFRLNKVRNIKTWLSVRSYLKKRGPQRSVDVIVSAAFIITLLLLSFLSMELLKDSVALHSQYNLEAMIWSLSLGILLLRFMTLGTKINRKYRNLSVLITEQINLYLQIEQKPHKKEELMVANSVLKLAADLLKELESPFKISGLSANPYLYTVTKVIILSALSGVLSEMLGFKLKLHKIKIK